MNMLAISQSSPFSALKRLGFVILAALLLTSLGACSASSSAEKSSTIQASHGAVAIQRTAADPSPPAGIVRYCWEEPMVGLQKNGPGLNPEGTWYNPSYIAVREVRLGRWRPCR